MGIAYGQASVSEKAYEKISQEKAVCRKEFIMIIIRAMGGLGNQLQQYALYKKLESIGRDVRIDISWFRNADTQSKVLEKRDLELDYLEGVSYRTAEPDEIRSVLGRLWEEQESLFSKVRRKLLPVLAPCFLENSMYHEEVFRFTDKYLVGYWACEKYYADILGKLRSEICFPTSDNIEIRNKNEAVMHRMAETESVSIHIRRGDYLEGANSALYGDICTDAYYEAAIAHLRGKFPSAKFFFFSDDIPYVREHYQSDDYEMIDWNHGKDSFYDMMLMSRCKHNICANSTFSFWGARLNLYSSKIMVRPLIHRNNQVCVPGQMKELWKDWILITPQGNIL